MSTATPPPAAVTFDHPPADEELQFLVDPDKAPPYLRPEDDGTTLTVSPKPFSMWFFQLIIWPVAAVITTAVGWEDIAAAQNPALRGLIFAVAIFAPMAVGFPLLVSAIVHHRMRADPFFVLDRAAGTLTLLRAGVTLRRGDVVELVDVQATHWVEHSEGWSGDRLREVSVLARGSGGTLTRCPVVIALYAKYAKPVGRVADELAGFLGVPRRVLVQSYFRKRWRRVE